MGLFAETLSLYGWWILGLVLLVLEAVLPGVFLLFFGIAALVVGTNAFFIGGTGWFGWEQQVLAFVVLSVVAVFLGRRWYGSRDARSDPHGLNRRTDRLVGRRTVLTEPIAQGRGRVAVEDGWWVVEGPDLPAGARVTIVGARGSILVVEADAR